MPTFMPLPSALKASPKAAVDFPLPLPVWTIRRPFSIVLVARIFARASFFLRILSAWRALISASERPSVFMLADSLRALSTLHKRYSCAAPTDRDRPLRRTGRQSPSAPAHYFPQ